MNKSILFTGAMAVCLLAATNADAQRVRGARENVAGGITADGAHDVSGPFGSRAVGEGGVVTNGEGQGVGGSRGCARGGAGGAGCRAGTTTWDDGNVDHQSSAYAVGPNGNRANTQGSFSRDADGDLTGQRNSQVEIGDRTYNADTTFESGEGFDRNVSCSGSGCPN